MHVVRVDIGLLLEVCRRPSAAGSLKPLQLAIGGFVRTTVDLNPRALSAIEKGIRGRHYRRTPDPVSLGPK